MSPLESSTLMDSSPAAGSPLADPVTALNRLLPILNRSLPVYLADARPWVARGREDLSAVVAQMAADQRLFAERVARTILDLGGRPEVGSFPTEFTDTHDLAVEFLLKMTAERQRRDLEMIGCCAHGLAEGSPARALADEILAHARRHLARLEETLTKC